MPPNIISSKTLIFLSITFILSSNAFGSFCVPTKSNNSSFLKKNITNKKSVSFLFSFSASIESTNSEQRNEILITEKDREEVFGQLGYVPTNLVSIAARRGGGIGTPMVLKTYPINGGASRRKAKAEGMLTPFPTLYWFCCKDVSRAIADLERRGFVGKLEERLRKEPGTFEQFIKSHVSYSKERWESLTQEHQQYILKNYRMSKIIRDSGIAGTEYKPFEESRIPSIKCLHAHYGHYRAQIEKEFSDDDSINIVGSWIHELLEAENPGLIL